MSDQLAEARKSDPLAEARKMLADEQAARLAAFRTALEALERDYNCEVRAVVVADRGPDGSMICRAQIGVFDRA